MEAIESTFAWIDALKETEAINQRSRCNAQRLLSDTQSEARAEGRIVPPNR